jgi:glycosyltransferase involved in cell wall biosynthesis
MRTIAVLHIPEAGGPPQHVKPWLEALRNGGSVEVVVPGRGSAADLYSDFDRVDVLPYDTLTAGSGMRQRAAQVAQLARDVRLFRRHFESRDPDLAVLVTTVVPAALVAAALARVPRIVYAAEIFDKRYVTGWFRSAGARGLAHLVRQLSSAVVCCSDTVAAQFGGGGRVTTIYPGIDDSFANGDAAAFKSSHGVDDASPLLAVVGNISAGRGQDVLLEAFPAIRAKLPRARCVIVGAPHDRPVDRAYYERVVRLASDLGLGGAVVFTGFTPRIADVYAAADIVVNPARFNEPFGRVAIEALSAGRAVISARVGAVPEVLQDRLDALLVPPEDPSALADAVVELWENDELRTRLIERGRRTVEQRFDLREAVSAFDDVVAKVVGA